MFSILVIDDSAFARRIVAKSIEDRGWNVFEAKNGKEALETLGNQRIDLILLDLTMPEMDGRALLKEMQKEGLGIPVIVITADMQTTTHQEVMRLGVKKVFNKPIDQEILLKSILEIISERSKIYGHFE
ncbi:MAG: response regulator [Candidatus Hodarchaeota archaeon]